MLNEFLEQFPDGKEVHATKKRGQGFTMSKYVKQEGARVNTAEYARRPRMDFPFLFGQLRKERGSNYKRCKMSGTSWMRKANFQTQACAVR